MDLWIYVPTQLVKMQLCVTYSNKNNTIFSAMKQHRIIKDNKYKLRVHHYILHLSIYLTSWPKAQGNSQVFKDYQGQDQIFKGRYFHRTGVTKEKVPLLNLS